MILIAPDRLVTLKEGKQLSSPHFPRGRLYKKGASSPRAGDLIDFLCQFRREHDVGSQSSHSYGPLLMGLRKV